jgi:hypothetical protein
MYMYVETCSSSPFWMNVGGINVLIRTANGLCPDRASGEPDFAIHRV